MGESIFHRSIMVRPRLYFGDGGMYDLYCLYIGYISSVADGDIFNNKITLIMKILKEELNVETGSVYNEMKNRNDDSDIANMKDIIIKVENSVYTGP